MDSQLNIRLEATEKSIAEVKAKISLYLQKYESATEDTKVKYLDMVVVLEKQLLEFQHQQSFFIERLFSERSLTPMEVEKTNEVTSIINSWQNRVFFVKGDNFTGSCVLIDEQLILTAAHLSFKVQQMYDIQGTGGRKFKVKCNFICEELDFAILTSNDLPNLLISTDELIRGDRYFIMGYPDGVEISCPTITNGMIEGIMDDHFHKVGTPGLNRGYTGAPVIKTSGSLAGLLLGGTTGLSMNATIRECLDPAAEQKCARILGVSQCISHYNSRNKAQLLSIFETKVPQFQKDEAKSALNKAAEDDNVYCAACGKKFKSINAYENHLPSKKHKENEKKFEENEIKPKLVSNTESSSAITVEDVKASIDEKQKKEGTEDDNDSGSWQTVDEEEGDFEYDESKALPSTSCLFCPAKHQTYEANLQHMTSHGFYIQDSEYCVDPEGLLNYLGMKVGCGNVCVYCNKRSKYFRTLDAVRKHMKEKQHCKFTLEGEEILEFLDFYDYESLLREEADEYENINVDDGFTLMLPSGARIGHRDLLRYYKQHLRREPLKMSAAQTRKALDLALGKTRALGWTGEKGELAVVKARDMRFMRKVTQKYWTQSGIKSNKLIKSKGRDDQM